MKNRKLKILHVILILLSFTPAAWIMSQPWTTVVATVESTQIERTRPGTPEWSLWVDFRYEVKGTEHLKQNVDVFHDRDRKVTEAEQENWFPGREVTVYCSQRNPQHFSLEEDGGLEGAMVLAVVLSVAVTLVLLPFHIAQSRTREH